MQKTVSQDFKRELKLTLDNTQELYKVALAVTNLHWESEEIDNLYVATVQQIKDNGGADTVPTIYTDHQMKDAKEVIVAAVRDLQEEAKQ